MVSLAFSPALPGAPLRVFAAMALAVVWLGGSAAWAQAPSTDDTQQGAPLRLRNIYVPEGEISKWPTEGKTYLPIDAAQLAMLLELANRSAPDLPRVTSTVLHATTDPAGVLQGTGHLRIELAGTAEAWLPFPESNGRIAQAWWDSPPGSAQLGYRGGGGGLSLRVPRSGQLELEWELAPHTPQGDYELRLPPSLATLLVLDLAEGEIPQMGADARVLVIPPQQLQREEWAEWGGTAVPPPVAGRHRWVLVASPGAPLAWQMRRPSNGASTPQERIEYSAASHYRVAENGTHLTYRLRLEGEHPLPSGLVLDAPRDLVVTDMKWGDQSVGWSRDGEDGSYLLAIDGPIPAIRDLPASDSTDPRPGDPSPPDSPPAPPVNVLTIEAWCPTPLRDYWQVPQLELRGGFWLYESLAFAITPALELRDMTHSHLRLASGSTSDPAVPLEFHKLRPTGRLRVELARRTTNPCVRIGRYVELDGVAATASVRSVFECDQQGDVYHLQAEVLPGWNIQSVLTRSAHRVEDWYLSKDREGRSVLTLRATVDTSAPTRNEPLDIDIEAHRSVSSNRGWQSIADHLVLRWSQVDTLAEYIAFGAAGPYQVDFLGTPAAVPERQLDPIVGPLLPSDVTGDVFDLNAMSDNARVNLVQPPVEYDAEVMIDVWDEEPTWRRECRVAIDPRQGLVAELPVLFSGLGGETFRWRLASQSEWRELAPLGPANAEAPHARRTLVLSQPMAAPFELVIDLGGTTSPQLDVAPIQLPDARQQTTHIQVHTPEPTGLVVQPSDFVMEPLPPSGENMGVHSVWRMTLPEGRPPGETTGLHLRREATQELPPRALVERATLHSQYVRTGSSHHRYELVVENQGESQLECRVPDGAQNVRWWRPETSDEGRVYPKTNEFAIPLPPGEQRPGFRVEFTLPRQGIASERKITPPWPTLSLPVIRGEWVVEVPGSYLLAGGSLQEPQPSWKGRLLGVFARQRALSDEGGTALRTYRVETPAQGPIALRVVDHERRLAWCLFLATMSVVACAILLKRWLAYGIVAAGILTAATLLLPWGWSLYASALNAGLWLGIAIHLLRSFAPRTPRQQIVGEPPSESVSLLQVTGGALVVLALLLPTAGASQSSPPTSESPGSIEAVLIPVDGEGRPASDQHFVTPRLLRELLARRDAQQASEGWMITSATYEGELLPSTGSARLQSGGWTLAYGLEVFHRGSTIELPLSRAQGAWEATVSVDGIATPLEWNADGQGCRFQIGEPGRYLVKLRCTPVVTLGDQTAGVALRLPPVGAAELRLKTPSSRNEIRIDGAPLPGTLGMGSLYRVKLAMRPELRIEWPSSPSPSPVSEIQASERTWMHVSPEGMEVDVVLKLRGNGALPERLRLESNQAAQRLDGPDGDAATGLSEWRRWWSVRTEPNPISPDGRMVRVRLRLPRSDVWGRVRFPQFHLEGVTIVERHFAASATPGVVLSLDTDTVGSSTIDPDTFLADWPEETLPEIALQKGPQAPWPVLVVAPHRDDLSPDETLHLCGFSDRLEVEYEGEFPRGQSQRLVQTLRISPELEIQRVSVVQTNHTQEVRYTRPQPDRLVVWLESPTERTFRLEVAGKVEAQSPGTIEVPQLSTWSHPPTSQRLLVYSARELTVELPDDQPTTSSDPPSSVPSQWDAYAVGSYQVATLGTAPLVVRLAPNRLRYEAQMLTAMLPTQEGWVAEVVVVANVLEGRLSQLELDLPRGLAERAQLDTPSSASLDRSPGGKLRIVLGKVATTGEGVQARLRIPVRPTNSGEVQVPDLRLRGAATVERYVLVLPGGVQSGVWVQRGVTAVEPPPGLQSLVDTWPEALVYRVSHNSPLTVRWIPRRPLRELASLGLMEVQVEYTPGGGCAVRTRMALPPTASGQALVRLPETQQLMAIHVDGAAGVVEHAGEQDYLLRLPEGELPHGIEVVTRLGHDVLRRGEVPLERIEVAIDDRTLEAERVMWRVVDRSGATLARSTSAASLSALDGAAIRLTHLLDALGGSSAGVATASQRTQEAWAGYWYALVGEAQAQLAVAIEAHSQSNPAMVDVVEGTSEFDELLQRSADRMKTLADIWPPDESPENWPRRDSPWVVPDENASRFVTPGSAGPLVVTFAPLGERGTQQRWIGAIVVLVLTVGIALVTNRIGRVALHDPLFFAGVLVLGVAWWLWAPLRWGGFAIALAAILAWMRWSRRSRPR